MVSAVRVEGVKPTSDSYHSRVQLTVRSTNIAQAEAIRHFLRRREFKDLFVSELAKQNLRFSALDFAVVVKSPHYSRDVIQAGQTAAPRIGSPKNAIPVHQGGGMSTGTLVAVVGCAVFGLALLARQTAADEKAYTVLS